MLPGPKLLENIKKLLVGLPKKRDILMTGRISGTNMTEDLQFKKVLTVWM